MKYHHPPQQTFSGTIARVARLLEACAFLEGMAASPSGIVRRMGEGAETGHEDVMTRNYKAPPDAKASAEEEAPRKSDVDELVGLDSAAQALIGQQLSTMYSELLNQEIPEHLRELLRELEAKEKKS